MSCPYEHCRCNDPNVDWKKLPLFSIGKAFDMRAQRGVTSFELTSPMFQALLTTHDFNESYFARYPEDTSISRKEFELFGMKFEVVE